MGASAWFSSVVIARIQLMASRVARDADDACACAQRKKRRQALVVLKDACRLVEPDDS
jgi:hypothetical protein